jgi:hypothetical protein
MDLSWKICSFPILQIAEDALQSVSPEPNARKNQP